MRWLKDLRHRIREHDRLANISEIGRRYFAMNAFDGVLTIIGVLMGTFTAGVSEPRIVVSTGLATCVSMGISGLWGAYLTEAAERKRDLAELSRFTLTDLTGTRVDRASRMAVVVVALVDGFAPVLSGLVVLIPFLLASLFPVIEWVYYASLGMALLSLLGLGFFLGSISQTSLLLSGAKTVFAGVVSILVSFVLRV